MTAEAPPSASSFFGLGIAPRILETLTRLKLTIPTPIQDQAIPAALNGVESRCRFLRAEAFAELARLSAAGERFDIVVADPPAFVPSRKDLAVGLRGYRKLARLSAALVAPGGFLFIASCSHNVDVPLFAEQVRRGLDDAHRSGRILRTSGAAADHPVHPHLPESAYLQGQLIALD